MKIIDISWPVKPDMVEFEGRKIVTFEPFGNETKLTMINHTGTHIDGPQFFFKDAKMIDEFSLTKFICKCQVLDLMDVKEKITADDLAKLDIKPDMIVLFKTTNSLLPETYWEPKFVHLDVSGAEYL